MAQQIPKFLTDKGLTPNVGINPDLNRLGTETAFGFGAEVMSVEQSKKFPIVYKFHIGDTGPTTPEPIINTAIQALKDKQTKYGHYLGFPIVRQNIANYVNKRHGINIEADNVILEPGGKPAIELAIQSLLEPGDYIVGQNPGFPIYESLARFYAGNDHYIPWLARQDEQNGTMEFMVEDLEKIFASGKKIKLLIINTPQNPTGMVLAKEKLLAIAELVKKYKFMALFDDIYDQIIFGGREHFSLLSVPGMLDYTINLNGYSKNYAMTGWRMGYVVAPKWLIAIFGQIAINKWSCINTVSQIIAGAIFGDVEINGKKYPSLTQQLQPLVAADVVEYQKKGNFVEASLKLLKPFVVPNAAEGAFYLFPNIKKVLNLPYVKNELKINSDKDFCKWLLAKKGFAVLAGSDFGEGGIGYLRLSYAEDRDKHIIPGIKHFIKIIIELIEKSGQASPLKAQEIDNKVGEIEKKCF